MRGSVIAISMVLLLSLLFPMMAFARGGQTPECKKCLKELQVSINQAKLTCDTGSVSDCILAKAVVNLLQLECQKKCGMATS